MSTKPMLFSTSMVQAVLEGQKTQTRRVIPEKIVDEYYDYDDYVNAVATGVPHIRDHEDSFFKKRARYQPGDILWVREAWSPVHVLPKRYLYKADAEIGDEGDGLPIRWRPSIHMPKEAARIFLRVTGVRVEKLQDITLKDIEQEGLYCDPEYADPTRIGHYAYEPGMRIHFTKLWDSLNAKRGYGWDTNPWVWVYTFERTDKPAGWPGGEVEE